MKKLFFFILLLLTMNMLATDNLDTDKILPANIDSWQKAGSHTLYTPGNLYEYINGGAELYLSFGFNQVKAYRYVKKDNPQDEITIDVFDMATPANAFGVFSLGCETCDTTLGNGSQYSAGSLVFWKGRYYISILSFPESEEKKKVIMALGRLLNDAIKEKGQLPVVVTLLPKENQVAGTVRYFRHHIWLNSLFYIANENILDIGPNTEAAMAKYSYSDSYYYLLFIDYPGQKQAEQARAGFIKHFLSGTLSGIMQLEDGKWTGCKQYGNRLIVVFNANNKALVNKMIDFKIKE